MRQGLSGRLIVAALVPVAMLIALMSWAVSSPVGSSPDDDYHMASIWCAQGEIEGRCEAAANPEYRYLPADLVEAANCFKHESSQPPTCPLRENEMQATSRGNWSFGGYPPVYYSVMSIFVTSDLTVSVILMRAVNIVLYLGILVALFLLLPRRLRPPLVWSSVITIVPLGMFLIASMNPSAWAIISAAGLWLAMWGFFEQRGARKWMLGALTVLLVVLGAGARSDSAAYAVLAMTVGAVLAFRKDRTFAFGLLLPAGLSLVAAAFFFSGGQSALLDSDTANEDPPFGFATMVFVNLKLLPQLWAGVFGYASLGWFDTPMPGVVWITSFGLFAGVVFWGLRIGDIKKRLALLAIALSLVVVPMYILLHDGVIVGQFVQPRYFYPLIIMLGGVAVVAFSRADLGMGRLQRLVLVIGLTIAQSTALHVNLRRYVTGLDQANFNLNGAIEWWWGGPVSPMLVWAIGSASFGLALAALTWITWPIEKLPPAVAGRGSVQESQSSTSSAG